MLQGLGKLHRLPVDEVRQLAWNIKEQRNTLAIAFGLTAWEMPHSLLSLETISYQAHEPNTLQRLGKLHRLPVDAVRQLAWNVREQINTLANAFDVTAWQMPLSLPTLETISYQSHKLISLQGLGKLHRVVVVV